MVWFLLEKYMINTRFSEINHQWELVQNANGYTWPMDNVVIVLKQWIHLSQQERGAIALHRKSWLPTLLKLLNSCIKLPTFGLHLLLNWNEEFKANHITDSSFANMNLEILYPHPLSSIVLKSYQMKIAVIALYKFSPLCCWPVYWGASW